MEHRIESAERRYRQIVPDAAATRGAITVGELRDWLRGDVAPLVGEFAPRPKFREAACWPLVALPPGADTPARRQLDAVSAALRGHARLLKKALQSRRVAAALREFLPPLSAVTTEEVVVGASHRRTVSCTTREVDRPSDMAARVGAIARPFWRDLVCPDDYMGPVGGWLRDAPRGRGAEKVADGDFVVSLNPELHPIGDFVTRCLFRRVETLVDILREARGAVLSCAGRARLAAPGCLSELAGDADRLRDEVRRLHKVCRPDGEFATRDSCVTLTQVYAAFHPAPDLAWLGLDGAVVERGRMTLGHRWTHSRGRGLTERVAAALGDLRRLYANEPPGRSALDEARARGGLVLTTQSRRAYWAGKLVADKEGVGVDWYKEDKPWELLLALARKGYRGDAVEERDMYSPVRSLSAMSSLCDRLRKLLPPELCGRIAPGKNSARSYRLKLDRDRITIIDQPV